MFYKPEFRRKITDKRKSLNEQSVRLLSTQIEAQIIVLPELIDAKHIAYYISHDNEVDTATVLNYELHQDKLFYLPVVHKAENSLSFYLHDKNKPLVKNKYGIPEPDITGSKPIELTKLDIIIVPLVGFDAHCNRLGRGAGYYDRALSSIDFNTQKRPKLIGLAYEFQKIEHIEPSEWDVPLDFVITERTIYRNVRQT